MPDTQVTFSLQVLRFLDRITTPFDARQDRHVGRRDYIPNFGGVWEGLQIAQNGNSAGIRIVITQDGLFVNVSVYEMLMVSTPTETATGTISGGLVQFDTGGLNVLAASHWILSIKTDGKLHFDCHRQVLHRVGEIRPRDWSESDDSFGDLSRM